MEYGFGIPTRGPLATPENIMTLAQRGEEMGFDIITVSDHVIIPRDIQSRYPYNETGEFAGRESGECMEQVSILSFLAGVTSSARLLSSIMVLPHRNPVLAAKMLATVDVLSHGRLYVGCGVGWMREEFEAIGTPPFEERGAVSDEYIRVFRELWTSDNPTFKGDYCNFSNVSFRPRPVQEPHPPIWVGGESPPALRRAARLGDAWYPIGSNPRYPLGTPEQLSTNVDRLRLYAQEAGRDPYSIDLGFSVNWYNDRQAQMMQSGDRRMLTGSAGEIAGDIKVLQDIGVQHLVLNFQADTMEETLGNMERFAAKIRPLADA